MTAHLDALAANIPKSLDPELSQFRSQCPNFLPFIDTLIRFASGADAPNPTTNDWLQQQQSFLRDLSALKSSSSQKRAREGDDESESSSAKRTKTSSGESDDPPLYTLHSISVTSPIRKKVDISIHANSIQFTNPTTKSVESTVLFTDIKRAFLLPTRGKRNPHYTVAILTSDYFNPARGKAVAASSNAPQINFGVDATPPSAFTTTTHPDPPKQHPKGSSIVDCLHEFLSHLPTHALPVMEPSLHIHTNAAGSPGVDAYRAAKPGTLWFLDRGVLWDAKPMEFWDLKDLVSSEAGGLRLLSATGRTCSVILRRKLPQEEGSDEEEAEEEGLDTDFGMVEGKEQDGITQWVKKHGPIFGKKVGTKPDAKGKGKEVAKLDLSSNPMAEAESDLDDDNYTASDASEDLSNSSEDESSEVAEGDDEDAEGSADDEDSNQSGEEEELQPENHPLMRPGAMPRMSQAAIDAVVGMVETDLFGAGNQRTASADEEDELDE